MSSQETDDPAGEPVGQPDTRRREILEAFDEALDIPADERDAWLNARFGDDADAVRAVMALITADAMAPSAMPTELPGGPGRTVLVAPQRIGVYRLENIIGVGGMGEVWRGVRDDGLFDQEVAIKLMRPSRYATESLAFFDTERRALARLNHRHIARLFDGGVTETGLPWFIMELVDGLPLHLYAAGRRPDRTAAIRLMIAIAEAAQYAHQQLVVHADLKPSNILITPLGEPCLVDFGIASLAATAAEQADKAAFPSTPAYASPQRLKGEAPTPADDIFSLGLLLHGLLTTQWPEKPVTAPLSATGDLNCDAIIARACATEVDARYATAEGFAEDLRAVLEDRPTSLQQGDWRQEGRLFVRRHPKAMGAAAAALVTGLAALVTISVLYVRADEAHREAAARFADVRSIAHYMLFDLSDRLEEQPRSLGLRTQVAAVSQHYLDRLTGTRDAAPAVRLEAAEALLRLAERQGSPGQPNMGDTEAARRNLDKGLIWARSVDSDDGRRLQVRILVLQSRLESDRSSQFDIAEARLKDARAVLDKLGEGQPQDRMLAATWYSARCALLQWQGKYKDSMAAGQAALTRLASLPQTEAVAVLRLQTLGDYGDSAFYGGDRDGALALYQQALALARDAVKQWPEDPLTRHRLMIAQWEIATTQMDSKRFAEAMPHAQAGWDIAKELMAREPDDRTILQNGTVMASAYAQSLAGNGQTDRAVSLLAGNADRWHGLWQASPRDGFYGREYAITLAMRADILADAGRAREACPIYGEVNTIYGQLAASGNVAKLDVDYSQRQVRERVAAFCPK